MSPNMSVPPTGDQIQKAFQAFVDERATAGVRMAQAVSDITYSEGTVTVTLDPDLSGAEYWALMETRAHENPAHLFGVPIAFNDDDGTWLRHRVERVDVVDVDGRQLGTATAEDIHHLGTGGG